MATRAPAPPAVGAYVVYDRQVDVETPEHVTVGYQLADLGSRFTAVLLDTLVIGAASFAVILGMMAIGVVTGGMGFNTVILPLLVILSFLAYWGYYFGFEAFRDGQTPGKRWMGLRVVQDGGYPVTVRAAAVRNLIRIIDMQPGTALLVGGLTMLLHPRTKRLGDMAAGTVVVRDRAGEAVPEEIEVAAAGPSTLGPPRLTDAEWAALSMYVERAPDLEAEVRTSLARRLAGQLAAKLEGDPSRTALRSAERLTLLHDDEGRRRASAGGGGRAGTAQATALLRRQRGVWREYEGLLKEAQGRGLRKIGEVRVSRFAALYREVASDLARARTYGGSPPLLYSLERSVGAGHNLLYRSTEKTLSRIGRFLSGGFAALVRKRWLPVSIAALLFWGPLLGTILASRFDPELPRRMLPAEMIVRAEEAAEKEARGEGYVEEVEMGMPFLATSLISNNVQVTFLAFAGGVLAALGTVLVLVFNGLSIGASFAAFINVGQFPHLLDFVGSHGVIELSAIVIAGGAGLWMGSALLVPGRVTRRQAMVERGREAVALIGGCAVMLIVAGLIEGFISPSELSRTTKFVLASTFAVVTLAYFLFAGRGKHHQPIEERVAGL